MKKVTCTSINATSPINGIPFDGEPGALVAILEDDVAAQFDGISVYRIEDAESSDPAAPRRGRPPKSAAVVTPETEVGESADAPQ